MLLMGNEKVMLDRTVGPIYSFFLLRPDVFHIEFIGLPLLELPPQTEHGHGSGIG